MNTTKVKHCSSCQNTFECGADLDDVACWCNDFPPIINPIEAVDCLCPKCLQAQINDKFVSKESVKANKDAPSTNTSKRIDGIAN